MRQQLLNRIAVFATAILMAFAIPFSAVAAPADSQGFNHAHTGYQLTGAHAVAACETCHAGGVFEGTPQKCDECHEVGRRVVATPKSSAHIVTIADCDTCHFSTITFLGAKFNHGMAIPGSCDSCHNGRIEDGRPGSHNSGIKLTKSCDSCHRSTGWLPATWNHTAVVPGGCDDAGCHVAGSNQYFRPTTATHTARTGVRTYECDDCHVVFGWSPNKFKHNRPGLCANCHNSIEAYGKPLSHTPATIKGKNACDDCHIIQGWSPNNFKHNTGGVCASCHDGIQTTNGKPASHTPASIKGMNACDDCHTKQGWLPASFKHNIGGQLCSSCHNAVKAIGEPGNHLSFPGWPIECNQCHLNTTSFSGALGGMPTNHIPFNPGVSCSDCHIGAGVKRGPSMHVFVSALPCTTCHLRGNPYLVWGQDSKSIGHEGMRAGDDCSQSGCHRPGGNKGNAFINWD